MTTTEQPPEKKSGFGKILLIIGVIIVIYVLGTMALNYPRIVEAKDMARSGEDQIRARRIGQAILAYTHDHNGMTPPNLEGLCPTYLNDASELINRFVVDGKRYGYEFMLPNTDCSKIVIPRSALLLRGQYENGHGEHNHVYLDGNYKVEKEIEVEMRANKQNVENMGRDLEGAMKIGKAIRMYAAEHNATTPPDLEALCPKYLQDFSLLKSPVIVNGKQCGYELMLPNKDYKKFADPRSELLLRGLYVGPNGEISHVYLSGDAKVVYNR